MLTGPLQDGLAASQTALLLDLLLQINKVRSASDLGIKKPEHVPYCEQNWKKNGLAFSLTSWKVTVSAGFTKTPLPQSPILKWHSVGESLQKLLRSF